MADRVVTADIAGAVFSIDVAVGEAVAVDQALCVLESMKMHIPVESPAAGTVAEILVAEGDTVAEGQALVRLTL
ncbi:MAG: acetyl-CoA carboxylase biotin carboxyl carrier protein subunit [Alphaproteobacteria bacterium]